MALFAALTVALGLGDSDRRFLMPFRVEVRRNAGTGKGGA